MPMNTADYEARIAHLELVAQRRQAHIEDLEAAHAALVAEVNAGRRALAEHAHTISALRAMLTWVELRLDQASKDRDFWFARLAATLRGAGPGPASGAHVPTDDATIVAGIWDAIGAAEGRQG